MAFFKVKIQQIVSMEGVIEAASAEEVKTEVETNHNVVWWAQKSSELTSNTITESVELEEKASG
jgi:hypothetical protein|tara:strand:- start:2317 stop:2508 length:192 start_codon:yes stop_codon:yes gene_type:complete